MTAEEDAIGLTYQQALAELEASEAEREKLLARVAELEAAWSNLHAVCNPGAPPLLVASLCAVNLIAPGAVLVREEERDESRWRMMWNRQLTADEKQRVNAYMARMRWDARAEDQPLSRARGADPAKWYPTRCTRCRAWRDERSKPCLCGAPIEESETRAAP